MIPEVMCFPCMEKMEMTSLRYWQNREYFEFVCKSCEKQVFIENINFLIREIKNGDD